MSIQSARSSTEPIVLKVGGSLLDVSDLMDRLRSLMQTLQSGRVLIVPGGGSTADLIRTLDQRFGISPERAHWAAIAAMSSNAMLLARLNGELRVVANRAEAGAVWLAGKVAVLDVLAFLQAEEQSAGVERLPASWDVTSDSIAVWIAGRWPASQVVVAKSCDPVSPSISTLVQHRMLDPLFGNFVGATNVVWTNLRKSPLSLMRLRDNDCPPP